MAGNEEKLQQLQLMEQSMSNLPAQKQQFHARLSEVESALKEMKGKDHVYRIIGSIMVKSTVPPLEKDFAEQVEILNIRIGTIEKQEESFRQRAKKLQEEIMKGLKKE